MRSYALAWLFLVSSVAGVEAAATESLAPLFQKVKPSVVLLRTERPGLEGSVRTVGSGVLISREGEVMTAAHLVQVAETITVRFGTGDTVSARVVASEPLADVALLRVERVPPGNMVAPLGDSDAVQIGDPVFIVGAPYGIDYTVSAGIVGGRRRGNTVGSRFSLAEFFQTDAAINPGNSGGPMFDMRGQVIGIVSHNISKSGGFEGLGFAVTAQTARRLLIEERSFWSGIQGYLLVGEEARVLNVPQPAGLLIQEIARGSPAERIGLRASTVRATIGQVPMIVGGDVVLGVDGIEIDDQQSLDRIRAREAQAHPGEPVSVDVLRGGKRLTLRGRIP